MKTPILICTIIISLAFVACGHNTDTVEFKHDIAASDGSALTESEKIQISEENLINRLQATIETFESVDKTVISIDAPSESEKVVDVLITTKSNEQLTDEQKTGIIDIIKASIGDDFAVTVDLREE